MSDIKGTSASYRNGITSVLIALPFVSLTGLFGKFLSHSPLLIVQGRTVFAFGTLLLALLILRKKIIFSSYLEWFRLVLCGVILGLHWIAFFKSIQLSTVAIGLLTFASYPLFTTFLEPIFFQEKLSKKSISGVFIVICGLALMATSPSENSDSMLSESVIDGVMWGLGGGLGFELLTLLNRDYVRHHSPLLLTCWQNGFAAIILLPWSLAESWILTTTDWALLFVLGVICTVGGHALLINGLRNVQAQTASMLIAGLEPVCAIIFALFLLGEIPSLQTLLGGVLIVSTTVFMIIRSE